MATSTLVVLNKVLAVRGERNSIHRAMLSAKGAADAVIGHFIVDQFFALARGATAAQVGFVFIAEELQG